MPTDASLVKDLMKQNLFGVFGERDAEKRRSLIAKIWDKKAFSSTQTGVTLGIQLSTISLSNCSAVLRFCILSGG